MLIQRAKIVKSNHEEKEQIWRSYIYHAMVSKTLWYWCKDILFGMTGYNEKSKVEQK